MPNDEWITPPNIVEAARQVLGGIDLDPCSTARANEVVRARRFYTLEDDGLVRPWRGNVFLNPPYSRGSLKPFLDLLFEELQEGHVSAAIVLTNAITDTGDGQWLLAMATSVCFLSGRTRFLTPDLKPSKNSPPSGQMVSYFGAWPHLFREHFESLGVVRSA